MLREQVAMIFQTWHGNCDWEDAPQQEKDDYRADADQILNLFKAEVDKLTVIDKLNMEEFSSHGYSTIWDFGERIARGQLQHTQNELREMLDA